MKEGFDLVYIEIGKKIRSERLSKNWTQTDLANRCKTVNREKISRIENAREDYMLSTLLELSYALELNPKYLFEF